MDSGEEAVFPSRNLRNFSLEIVHFGSFHTFFKFQIPVAMAWSEFGRSML